MEDNEIISLTADIVAAHVANNTVPVSEVSTLIRSVYDALGQAVSPAAPEPPKQEPAVSIKASVKPDHLVCLEDGKKLTMLKRYLRTNYDMTPEQYKAKWGLPRDYPMVAPNYAEKRRALAKTIGLGRKASASTAAKPKTPKAKAPSRAVASKTTKAKVTKPKPEAATVES